MYLLAFVLGEVITVLFRYSIILIIVFLVAGIIAVTLLLKKVIKKMRENLGIFVVTFLFFMTGIFLLNKALINRDNIYELRDCSAVVMGNVDKIESNTYGFNLYLKNVNITAKDKEFRTENILVTLSEKPEVKIGNKVSFKGKIIQLENAANKGNFDTKNYYMSLGIYVKASCNRIEIVESDYSIVKDGLYNLREKIALKLENICRGNTGLLSVINEKNGIISAIILGDRTDLDKEIKELYSASGIAHILAISGLHISFIGITVYNLLRKRFRFLFSAIISACIVVSFGIMSGFGIATIRAAAMFILKIIGEVLGRKYDSLTAISLAGLILLIKNPFVIYNSGFQMSFGAITAIVIVCPNIKYILGFKNKIIDMFIFNFTINLIMNPIIGWHYFELPTFSFLLNLVVVPLMSLVIGSSILGAAGVFISKIMGKILILPASLILEFYTFLCRVTEKIPVSTVIIGQPKITTLVIYYGVVFISIIILVRIRRGYEKNEKDRLIIREETGLVLENKEKKSRRKKIADRKLRTAYAIIFMILNIMIYYVPDRPFYITFLSVGQGDGIFIHTDNGSNILIDGGSTTEKQVAKNRITPYLKSQGIRKIDYSIITHTDSDHISGIVEMLESNNSVQIKNLVLPDINIRDENTEEILGLAIARGVNVLYIKNGDYLKFGKTNFKCINPDNSLLADDKNDNSTVLELQNGQFSALLTGDISEKVESGLAKKINKKFTVLKVAHHGSKYSSCQEFLKKVNPAYAIISVGEGNSYGHPGIETLERLNVQGSIVYRTDISGGITIYERDNGYGIEVMR